MKLAIFDIENWREIGATLARNKTRTFLTAFGIFWGTAMLAMLLGGASGMEGIMRRQFAGFATNMGATFSGTRSLSYKGFNKGSYWQLTEQDIALVRSKAPYIEKSSEINGKSVTATYGDKTKSCQVIGVEAEYSEIVSPILTEGRLLNETDVLHNRKVAVIGKNMATELFGSGSPLGKYVGLDGVYFLVVGVAAQRGDMSIAGRIDDSFLLPSTTMRRAYNFGNKVGFFVYTAPSGHGPSENEAAIRRAISHNHPIHPNDERAIQFMDISQNFAMVDGLFLGLSILALFVGAGSLMAGVIGVGNIMWIIVKERTHEFGIRRALGAKPLDITVQVLSESVVLTLISGVAGVCFATIVLGVVDMVSADPIHGTAGFQISFGLAMGIVSAFIVLGTAAGTLPAVKAMKIKPIEALRDK